MRRAIIIHFIVASDASMAINAPTIDPMLAGTASISPSFTGSTFCLAKLADPTIFCKSIPIRFVALATCGVSPKLISTGSVISDPLPANMLTNPQMIPTSATIMYSIIYLMLLGALFYSKIANGCGLTNGAIISF